MSKPFATLRVTFHSEFGGRPLGWEGDVSTDPVEDPDAYREQVGSLLNAMRDKFREKLEKAQK